MGKTVVLAEKPSVGRELARVLKCNKKGNGYIEGEKYIVTWALGHLVTLADPETYDDRYKSWKMEDLPMLPKPLKLVVIKQSGKQFSAVKEQLNRKDVTDIVIATDAGREGELVARWILEKARVHKPLKRLWISSQTDKAILDGFRNLKPAAQYDNLYKAASCRSEADWVVGLNITRALTCKHNAQLTAGRVQSATLAMIVNREEEIRNFKPKDYYVINAKTKGFTLSWRDKNNNNNSLFDLDRVNKILSNTKGKAAKVVDVNETSKKQFAPALYDLTELQRDANRIYGYSAKQTLSIMQRLYENYKVLTYPRTDSRYISSDIVATLPDRLKAIAVGSYRALATEILNGKINAHKGFVDNSKVSDHHAIIPTEERGNIALLSSEERHIYDLVVKRFLSVMLPPYEYLQTTITADINGETFIAKGNVVKSKGWKKVYDKATDLDDEEENDSQELPVVKKGDSLTVSSVDSKKLQTKAPARFNEGTLLSAMEKPHKYVSVDKVSAKTLGETGGIGTVATRADIIEKLFNMFYIEKNGKEIIPTGKGKQLIELVPEELKSPLMTAKWELELDLISKGKRDPREFTEEMRKYAAELVKEVKGSTDKFKHDNLTGKKCPKCGKYMLEVKGKHGVMNVCQDRACGHRENVSKFTNARCPECKKRLELRGQGEGQIYVCPNTNCNFREKASQFNKRFDSKNDKLNKRDVQNYMKKMKKEADEPINNPFGDLMAMFNKDK
ncbi:DNA topoisomerase-3 [Clostridium cavendishii DSM 21758]|uniref:DNA topoisomerase 3 n=1 Tax=Clostridium cavendishii DSM 21758 TaxID=1121302 RepID=A0A1M6D6I5_9CLOT|nr:DNA topoisomerase III [Clostridium cavendishii]SHI68837.1 DNA topoisomerase-3 [Clostridium cavendishii DSM 21758]